MNGEGSGLSGMKAGFGRHFMADLYLCQNELWNTPNEFMSEIRRITNFDGIINIQWVFQTFKPEGTRISGEFDDCFILIQIFAEQKFLTIDIFWWQPRLEIEQFSEALVELFRPQVLATESRLRAEHLN